MATVTTCNCKLPFLVEAHDLVGLKRAIEDPNMTCFGYPCHLQLGLNKNMRDHILEHQSVVERACVLSHFDMLELFLQNGCSANLPTSHGRLIHTVLTSCKSNRYLIDNGTALRVLRLLLATDCDVNVKDYNGKSPLLLATELADAGIMREILNCCLDWQLSCPGKGNGDSPLHMACMSGNVECVSLLLDRLNIEDVNLEDMHSFTPLLCSLMMLKNNMMFHNKDGTLDDKLLRVQYSHIAIIELLLAAGASPDKGPLPLVTIQGNFRQVTSRNGIRIALEIVQQLELKNFMLNSNLCNEFLPDQYSEHLKQVISLIDGNEKLLSPYAEVVRMLVSCCGISPYLTEDLQTLKTIYPCIKGLLVEIDEYLQAKRSKGIRPSSLMSLARTAIRLRVARCDKLFLLEKLPIPIKLKDYVRFVDL